MPKKLGLITLHGMGKTPENYANSFFEELQSRLDNPTWDKVCNKAVYYQDTLQDNQWDYYDRVKKKLDWKRLRQIMLYNFCDAATLETKKELDKSPYSKTQQKILGVFKAVFKELEKNRPVIIVANSLGGQVISSYLWDARKPSGASVGIWKGNPPSVSDSDETKFYRGDAINRLYTVGCNIPLFVAGHQRGNILAFGKPNGDFRWHNYYDEDDILGWPLSELSDSYEQLVEDHQINVGGLLTSWNPFCHTKYWSDDDFLEPLVCHMKSLLS